MSEVTGNCPTCGRSLVAVSQSGDYSCQCGQVGVWRRPDRSKPPPFVSAEEWAKHKARFGVSDAKPDDVVLFLVRSSPPPFVTDVVIRGPDGEVWHEAKNVDFRVTGEYQVTFQLSAEDAAEFREKFDRLFVGVPERESTE